MIYFDTDIAIGLLRGKFALKSLLDLLGSNPTVAITAPSIFELYTGIYFMKFNKKFKRLPDFIVKEVNALKKFRETVQEINFTPEAAKKSAEIYQELKSKGEEIDLFDCLIAGTILAHGDCDLLTFNEGHFNRIPGLNIRTVKQE